MEKLEFNFALLAERGANLCGADRLRIESCNQCQGQYLFNAELNDVYYDAEDLTRHFFKIAAMDLPPCRYCGHPSWDFGVVPDRVAVQSGPWAWTLLSRQFIFAADD
ncbi:hypothetical protein [Oceanicoccus sp. KOV_DT_Chl]|uniref:hypothetical protein n=1 Tax=Oceanicoccus sp. KOV_DT_Chl TaxID=1904639 RepID=UPI000C7E066C|nr:hypothetical protein [Oceanicoccus sp. KOV_DT_Chl]